MSGSLDTKYRPIRYDDVLGQEATKKILRRFVSTGTCFQQSYLFAGPFGSGKTTLGRIFARSMLCDSPIEGDPCNQCRSCKSILERSSSECFTEVDAATNSGKEDMLRLTESLGYDTFSGKRRLLLFDEAHRLSVHALDALLKPLEDTLPGSEDKRLVCIFCTTEPEKVRATILSRCAPAFMVHPVGPDEIADRLGLICQAEGIEFEPGVLSLIAVATECHIRDAIKAVEGVRMLGPVNRENVTAYLDLDRNQALLDVLLLLPTDLPKALDLLDGLGQRTAPSVLYQSLAEAAMTAYQAFLGAAKPAVFWDRDRLNQLAPLGERLLAYALRFASRPGRPNISMLKCDVAALHHGIEAAATPIVIQAQPVSQPVAQPAPVEGPAMPAPSVPAATALPSPSVPAATAPPSPSVVQTERITGKLEADPLPWKGDGLVYTKAAAVRRDREPQKPDADFSPTAFDAASFCKFFVQRMEELAGESGGPSGRQNVDRP